MTDIQARAGGSEPPERGTSIEEPGFSTAEERVHARLMRVERMLGAHLEERHLPAWLRETQGESRWAAGAAILVAVALQVALPRELAFKPWWLLPSIELILLVLLAIVNPTRITRESRVLRGISLTLVGVATLANAYSAGRLVDALIYGWAGDAANLLLNGGAVWLTNVIVFALWYWEIDRGGPAARANARRSNPDFLFPQMAAPELAHRDWEPDFVDYLYVSFTNATAFSPTDTLPMTRWAKLAMMAQSAVSLVTVALVVARAVNIFK